MNLYLFKNQVEFLTQLHHETIYYLHEILCCMFDLIVVILCSTPNMWESCCDVCEVSCQSVSLLERYNGCPKHIARLKKLNMFPPLEPYEFTLLQFSRPSQEITKEGKCLKIICLYIYIFQLHNFDFSFIKFALSLL